MKGQTRLRQIKNVGSRGGGGKHLWGDEGEVREVLGGNRGGKTRGL